MTFDDYCYFIKSHLSRWGEQDHLFPEDKQIIEQYQAEGLTAYTAAERLLAHRRGCRLGLVNGYGHRA